MKLDTAILYGMTFFAFFFLLTGLSNSLSLGLLLTLIILLPGYFWSLWGAGRVSMALESEFKQAAPVVSFVSCPFCGSYAVQVADYLDGNVAVARGKCLEVCGEKFKKDPKVVNFG